MTASAQSPILVQTTLHDVSLYVGGCIASRRGSVELAPGCNHVYLAGIAKGVRDNSLRLRVAKGITQGQIRIVGSVPGLEGLLCQDAEAIQAAQDYDDEIKRLEAELDVCDVQLELWRKNGEFAYAGTGVTPADAIAYMQLLPEQLRALQARKRELTAQLKLQQMLLSEHMGKHGIRRRTGWEGASGPDRTYAPAQTPAPTSVVPASAEFVAERDRDARYVHVELWAEKAGACELELQYWQDGASWKPIYEISADALDAPCELRMRAHVTQTTKEDWHQVTVRLRTGNPSLAGSVSPVRPWYVDLRRNSRQAVSYGALESMPAPKAKRSGFLGAGMGTPPSMAPMEEAAADAFEPELERAQVIEADRHERQTMVEYERPGLWDVASGVDGQIVDLERRSINAGFHCYAFPRADDAVYLSAKIDGATEAFPLDGDVSCYLEGMFCGTTAIDAERVSAADFELPFGRTDSVRARRKQVLRRTTTSPLRNQAKTSYAFEITLENAGSKEVDLIVVDQVPVSRDTSIVVEIGQTSGAQVDEKTGEVRWTLRLAAGEKRTLALEYEVSYPKKEAVSGLDGPDYRASATRAPSMPFCPTCGSPIQPGLVFCTRCGHRLP